MPHATSNAEDHTAPPTDHTPLRQLMDSAFRLVKAFKCKNTWDAGGLTRTQLATLTALKHRSPRRITSLAEESRNDLSVLSRQIAALENWGMVERTRDPADGRAFLVSLTDHGRATLAEVWAKRIEELRGDLADFSDAELAHAAIVLDRIAASWDGRPAAAP